MGTLFRARVWEKLNWDFLAMPDEEELAARPDELRVNVERWFHVAHPVFNPQRCVVLVMSWVKDIPVTMDGRSACPWC